MVEMQEPVIAQQPVTQIRKRVLIIYRFLPQYRIDFYNGLRNELAKEGVELSLVYGKYKGKESKKKDEIDLPWAVYMPNKTINISNFEFIWQPAMKYVRGKDLVIVEQAHKNLINYLLIFQRKFRSFKLAFWGHGRNMQMAEGSMANKVKRKMITFCDWWFPYTEGVKDYIMENNFREDRISVVQNAIDTRFLAAEYERVTEEEIASIKQELGINSDQIGLYCGGIYKEKRIDDLVEICDRIREQVPDFHMVIIGSGTDQAKVEAAAQARSWFHYVGPKFGAEKVRYFKMSKVFLMPGLVGLAILDCFATRTPMITTEYPFHSPEIEYLQDGENGIITPDDKNTYIARVVEVLQHDSVLATLVEGCAKSATIYNNENMVNNFKTGIIRCLES